MEKTATGHSLMGLYPNHYVMKSFFPQVHTGCFSALIPNQFLRGDGAEEAVLGVSLCNNLPFIPSGSDPLPTNITGLFPNLLGHCSPLSVPLPSPLFTHLKGLCTQICLLSSHLLLPYFTKPCIEQASKAGTENLPSLVSARGWTPQEGISEQERMAKVVE